MNKEKNMKIIKDALENYPATARAFYKHFKKAKTTREEIKSIAKEMNVYNGYKNDFVKIELEEKLQVIGDTIIEVNNEISDYLKYDSSPPGDLYDKKQEAEYWFEEVKTRIKDLLIMEESPLKDKKVIMAEGLAMINKRI